METDTSLLLAGDNTEECENQQLKDLVLFYGKELSRSFLHTIQNPGHIRIGVGENGVYKVDSRTNKVLMHWKHSELKDWSYSGYSFTLQFRVGGNYYVRTDDGEAICSYIDAFQKNPIEALERAKTHPPDSKLPESGIRTLRRKFSGDPGPQLPSNDPLKFFTLNRRTSKKFANDPTNKSSHHLEVDSRLRTTFNERPSISDFQYQKLPREVPQPNKPGNSSPDKANMNGVTHKDEKQLARDMLAQRIEEAEKNEKRLSNGILMSPVSTKGESTKEVTTRFPANAPGTPPKQSSPLLVRKLFGHEERKLSAPSKLIPEATVKSDSKSGTPKPANQIQAVQPNEGAKAEEMRQTSEHNQNKDQKLANQITQSPQPSNQVSEPTNQDTEVGIPREGSPSDNESLSSGDTAPLLRPESSASSGPFSPTDGEFQFISVGSGEGGGGQGTRVDQTRSLSESSSSDDSHYDRLESIREAFTKREACSDEILVRSSSFDSTHGAPVLEQKAYEDEDVLLTPSERSDLSDTEFTFSGSVGSPESPVYDHLPALKDVERKTSSPQQSTKLKNTPKFELLPMPFDLAAPIRRNVSQPILSSSTPPSARESPCSQSPLIPEHSESEMDEEETPTNSDIEQRPSDFSGVVLRQKKKTRTEHLQVDPFADILGSPAGISRLRWSQELNPLYDYIKGVRISESMLSQNIKFYDAASAASASTPPEKKQNVKPPSVIIEEDSERESTTSPKEEKPTQVYPALQKVVESQEPSPHTTAASSTLPRTRRPHLYEEISLFEPNERPQSITRVPAKLLGRTAATVVKPKVRIRVSGEAMRSATLAGFSPSSRRLGSLGGKGKQGGGVIPSPRLGKRELQRRSRTIGSIDDTEAVRRKQKPMRASDNMKDFSYVMRDFRLFYIKMPNNKVHKEVVNINKPVSDLREKLCDLLGVDNPDNYLLHVEGAVLTTLKETDSLGVTQPRVNRSGSLTQLVDNQSLPDQGADPVMLKPSLSLRMQGITTSRILSLMSDDEVAESSVVYPPDLPSDNTIGFHRNWVSIVQGNHPICQDDAVKLAALQYQAYVLDRTAVHSVVGFCRPTEFLPAEHAGVRGIEQRMYKEQDNLRLHSHKEIYEAYSDYCSKLPTHDAVFFPAREPRKKLLQSTKLKPILLGVSSRGVMRVDPKTKEVLDMWEFQVLKNWAYSRRTFVLAFSNKNYPVESNQAKWISELVDFHVDSILGSADSISQIIPGSEEKTS